MKKLLVTTLALAATSVFAQTATVGQSSDTNSAAQAGSMAIGGGAVSATIGGGSMNATIGGNTNRITGTNTNRNSAMGGNGGNGQGGVASSNVTVNLGSTTGTGDPSSSDPNARPVANAQQGSGSSQQPSGTYHQSVETVGSPGSMSYGVSFSQYNCANTAGVGAGFMGGAFQIGIGKESDPCNARANAAALFSIAQALGATNAPLSAQLYHAAILLIGNSTSETKQALAAAGVSDWAPAPVAPPTQNIVPPPADESKAKTPAPAVAAKDDGVVVGEPISVYSTRDSEGRPVPIPLIVAPADQTAAAAK